MSTRTSDDSMTTQKKFRCEKCQDFGYVLVVESGREGFVECECLKVREAEQRLKNAGLYEAFKDKVFSNFLETKSNKILKEKCMEYVQNKAYLERSIILTGNVGSGKTHLATAITNNLLDKNVEVVYIDYRNFMTKLKQSILDREYYQGEIERLQNAQILFIDDLFKGKITESDVNIMFEIVNMRYLKKKQMIITSEKDIQTLLNIDKAVSSRIYEMSTGYVLHSVAENYRLRQVRE